MNLKQLKDILNGLGPGYNDHIIVLRADHHGVEIIDSIDTNCKFVDGDYYEKELYDLYEELEGVESTPCIVIG